MLRPFHSGPSLHRQLPLPLPDPVQPHSRPSEQANRLLTVQLLRGQPDHLPCPNVPLMRCHFHERRIPRSAAAATRHRGSWSCTVPGQHQLRAVEANRSRSENVASKKMADGGLPVIARFEVRHRNYLAPDGSINRPLPAFASDATLLVALYRAMVLVRIFDRKAVALQRTGRLGTYAVSLGQEAVSVGT